VLTLAARLRTLPREARDTLFLLLVIGWVLLPHLGHLPWWCILLAVGVLSWRATLAVQARPLRGRAWLVLLLVATVIGTWASHQTLLGREAGVTLIVALLALKTLELRARRDAFVVFFLGFFTMLTNFFFSQSLPTAVAMLVALLGLQAVHHHRDLVAERWPVTAAPLTAWCDLLACAIEAPRRIEDVAVESTALTRAAPGRDAFNLSVVLRNRGATPVAQPSVDLSLTDASGQVIARRMLAARDFRVAATSIKPGAETALQLVLSAGAARVSGYTVEIFYP